MYAILSIFKCIVSIFLVDVSDLYFKISPDGLTGSVITDEGFTYIWAGAKTTWGVNKGKVCYECKVGPIQEKVITLTVNMMSSSFRKQSFHDFVVLLV